MKKARIIYNEKTEAVIDVTKPPFNAVCDGKTDCTAAINKAIDFVTKKYIEAMKITKAQLEKENDENALLSFEVRKVNGKINVPFPLILPKGYVLYFPKGTYLVSDTLTYSHEDFYNILFGIRWLEIAGLIRIVGEEKENTVIKLKDDCKGFKFGARKPVINFCNGEKTGVAMSNLLQNITIDIGKNNAGAVGVRFICNNTGLVKDVDIRTSDENLRGYAGFEIIDEKVSCANIQNLTVIGFDYGIRLTPQQHNACFEHIILKNQKIAGFYHKGSICLIRDLKSENAVPAVYSVAFTGHLSILDSVFSNGSADNTAIVAEYGFCYFRNIRVSGYGTVLRDYFINLIKPDNIPFEYSSHEKYTLFENVSEVKDFDTADIPNAPIFETDYNKFAAIKDFGAVGDGVHDDTAAIKAAILSGKEGIYFDSGRYLITEQIEVPKNVKVIDFMFCDLLVSDTLALNENASVFKVKGAGEPVLFCNLFAWEDFHSKAPLVFHSGKRTLSMRLVHAQAAPLYKGEGENTVFLDSCACTLGGVPGGNGKISVPFAERFFDATNVPAFSFSNQKVFARALNPERARVEVINNGGYLTVLGGKIEDHGTGFKTMNGKTQVVGITCCIGANMDSPVIDSADSKTLAVFSTMTNNPSQRFPIAVRDTKEGKTKQISDETLPKRTMLSYVMPRYLG